MATFLHLSLVRVNHRSKLHLSLDGLAQAQVDPVALASWTCQCLVQPYSWFCALIFPCLDLFLSSRVLPVNTRLLATQGSCLYNPTWHSAYNSSRALPQVTLARHMLMQVHLNAKEFIYDPKNQALQHIKGSLIPHCMGISGGNLKMGVNPKEGPELAPQLQPGETYML